MYPDVEAVFVDTGLEYPEIRDFVKTFDDVTWLRPKMNFKEVIEKYGYPVISKEQAFRIRKITTQNLTEKYKQECLEKLGKWNCLLDAPFKISEQCCDKSKKEPFKQYEKKTHKVMLTGEMADDCRGREIEYLQNGCNAFELKRPKSTPIGFWTEQDLFKYITQNNIPIASCYGEIIEGDQLEGQQCLDGCMSHLTTSKCKRTGCMFCMFGVHLEKEPNRFQMMKETHPKQYDYCIREEYTYIQYIPYIRDDGELICDEIERTRKGLGLGKVLDYIGIKY